MGNSPESVSETATEIISVAQAAEMLGVTVLTIHRWKKSGRLPYIQQRRCCNIYFDKKSIAVLAKYASLRKYKNRGIANAE